MKRMDTAADRLLQSVRRLCRAGRTEVAVTDGRGRTIVGRLDPPLEAVSRCAGERQPIAATLLTNDGTVQRRNVRNAPALNARKNGMPETGALNALHHVFFGLLGEVKASTKMAPRPADDSNFGFD